MVRPTTRASNHRQSLVVSRSLARDSFPPPHPPIARHERSRAARPPRPRVIASPTATRHRENPITFPIESLARALDARARASPPPHRSTHTFRHHRSRRVTTPARPRARVHAPSSIHALDCHTARHRDSSPRGRRATSSPSIDRSIDPTRPEHIASRRRSHAPHRSSPRSSRARRTRARVPPRAPRRAGHHRWVEKRSRAAATRPVTTPHRVPLAPSRAPSTERAVPGGRHRARGRVCSRDES